MIDTEFTPIPSRIQKAMKKEKNDPGTASPRKWIIIEDEAAKAEELITFILINHHEDEIHLLYLHESDSTPPSYIQWESEGDLKTFHREIMLGGNRWEPVTGMVFFYWCKSRHDFIQSFDNINQNQGIILLDIDLPLLGGTQCLDGILSDKIREFLKEQNQSIVCIISRVVGHAVARRKIAKDGEWIFNRIYTEGASDWVFDGDTLSKDCKDVVERSHAFWNRLFGNDEALEDFLKNMAGLSVSDCHNWENASSVSLYSYQQRGTWDDSLGMPVQLKYLAEFLDFDPNEFINLFHLKNGQGYFMNSTPICECLKSMGAKDSHSFSLMGIAFISWAAYRRCFGRDAQSNYLFEKELKPLEIKKDTSRLKLITPPQKLDTLHKTIKAYYDMLPHLFRSQSSDEPGADLLKEVKLDESGFSMRFRNINPEKLHASIATAYKEKCLTENEDKNPAERKGGSDTARAILKFFTLNHYCDKMIMDKTPFLGTFFSLKIYAAGDYPENGIILKFGHDTT